MQNKLLQATKHILEDNLEILKEPYNKNKVVLVYDNDSKLASILAEAYIENLNKIKKSFSFRGEDLDRVVEIINFNKIKKDDLKEKLISLKENSTVILVQSTNFRLEDFRIRLTLHKAWVWCLEHNHLAYIKDDEIKNYVDVIEYKTPYFKELSAKLKEISDNANTLTIISKNGEKLVFEWWFEDMKQNTWDYTWKNRWWTFPIWENFTEIKDFKKANWQISIRAFPDTQMLVHYCEPFILDIKESLVVSWSSNTPKEFVEILEMIRQNENGEIYLRELGFWLNNWISWEKKLSDVNAFERIAWFHMSLWKKHWIYRKKFPRKVTQRYHIDIFSDTDKIYFDDKLIFENEKYII